MEKNKKSVGSIIVIVTLLLTTIGLGSYIVYDKAMKSPTEKEEKKETQETNDAVEITSEEETKMMKIANLVFTTKDNLKFNDIDNKDKLFIASNLSGKGIAEVTGNELKNVIKQNFGENATLTLVDFPCTCDKASYLYDAKTDRYVYNEEHLGHGGGGYGSIVYHLYKNKVSIEKNKYILTVDSYYTISECGDTCGGVKDENIYKTHSDAENNVNALLDATKNNNYCSQAESGLYSCDYDKVYNGIKEQHSLTKYSFLFEKENGNLVFKNYSINK